MLADSELCAPARLIIVMNCGLGNFDGLRKHLLAGSLQGEKKFDAVLQDIGLGVAAMMENFCNRKFARAVGDQAVFPGDRASFVLHRYPVEALTKIELRMQDSEQFVEPATTSLLSVSLASGIVYFNDKADGGPYYAQVRLTFTGGYWFETLEPEDEGYPSTAPAGAALLPPDLRLAWLIQCREVWSKIDKLGTGIVDTPDKQSATGVLDLSPMVKSMLRQYVQYQPI